MQLFYVVVEVMSCVFKLVLVNKRSSSNFILNPHLSEVLLKFPKLVIDCGYNCYFFIYLKP